MFCQGALESLEVFHPLHGEIMWLDVCLVEHQDKWEFSFV
jgi:hypothetical protein